jgi:hypothetical protein
LIINLASVNTNDKPVLILKSISGIAIQTLGYAYNVTLDICYNEISKLTFDIPAYVDGVRTPNYDEVKGSNIVDVLGFGQFILFDPQKSSDGIKEIKSCSAYSLEYEFAKKVITIENGTYNFWNPLSPSDTIIGIILEKMTSWTVGSIDQTLIGKYRTFEASGTKIYDFIKSTVQESYGCIFDFDTYNRVINVVSVNSVVPTKPIYLSKDKLVKKIDIDENSDEIITCLDVNGAEGVNIRSVNPMGTNKIYNLDYFMNETNFTSEMIAKWESWKSQYNSYQVLYYNKTVELNIQTARYVTEQAKLTTLNGELTSLENIQAVIIQGISQGLKTQADLNEINLRISNKNNEISAQNAVIANVQASIDSLSEDLTDINQATSFESFFSSSEITLLERYFIEDSFEDSTFVSASTETYDNDAISSKLSGITFDASNSTITTISIDGHQMYSLSGGQISLYPGSNSANPIITANVIKACFDNVGGQFVFTAYLNSGNYTGQGDYDGACITATGTCQIQTASANALKFYVSSGDLYFTINTTEYAKQSVEWDLYDYGVDVLEEKAFPSYTFNVECGNFLVIDDFITFKNSLSLGKRIYLNLDGEILTPYVVGMSINYENKNQFTLELSSWYSSNNKAFAISDLIKQSLSMGKTLNLNKNSYSSFVSSGASTAVKSFMDSALDIAKNAVLSSGNQAIEFGDSGLKLRQWTDDTHTAIDDEQIWLVNNIIAFTDDNWSTAKMAIGKIFDENLISEENPNGTAYGIVAPYIVGTLLAGSNLVIDTETGSFKVDSSGVHIDSMQFYITHGGTEYSTLEDELSGLSSDTAQVASDLADAVTQINEDLSKTVTTYYQNTEPEEANNGDLWFNTDTGKLYRYNSSSTTWDSIEDSGIVDAIGAAANAQETADKKIVTYYQDYAPHFAEYGDLWFNTATSNTVTRKIVVGDNLSNKQLTFDTSVVPASVNTEKLIDMDSGRYIGSSNYGTILYTNSPSTTVLYTGSDGWTNPVYTCSSNSGVVVSIIDTNPFYNAIKCTFTNSFTPKKFYRYNGVSWEALEDGDISTLKTNVETINTTLSQYIMNNGYLNASKLSGVINSTIATMRSSNGNVLFDKDGIWLMNQTTRAAMTKAVWMNESGIAFGTGIAGADVTDTSKWTWTTAINHDGIVADALAGKTISGGYIYGGRIDIGNGKFTVTEQGYLTAETGIFKGTLKAAVFQDSSGNAMTNSDYKFKSDYLDMKGISVKNSSNATTFSVDSNGNVSVSGKITMGSGSSINWSYIDETGSDAYVIAAGASSTASSAYNRASTAISTANSAANIASSIADGTYSGGSFINGTSIYSPTIYSNEFNVIPCTSSGTSGSYNLYAYYGGTLFNMLKISYFQGTAPYVTFGSPCSAYLNWTADTSVSSANYEFTSSSRVYFYGSVDFTNATVTGLGSGTAKFG